MTSSIIYSHAIIGNDDGNIRMRQIENSRDVYKTTLWRIPKDYSDGVRRRLVTNLTATMDSFLAYSGYENVLLICGKTPVRVELDQLPLYHAFSKSEYNLDVVQTEDDERWDKLNVSTVSASSTFRLNSKDYHINTSKKYDAIVFSGIDMWISDPEMPNQRSIAKTQEIRYAFRAYGRGDFDILDFNQHANTNIPLRRVVGKKKDYSDRWRSFQTVLESYTTGVQNEQERSYYFDKLKSLMNIY